MVSSGILHQVISRAVALHGDPQPGLHHNADGQPLCYLCTNNTSGLILADLTLWQRPEPPPPWNQVRVCRRCMDALKEMPLATILNFVLIDNQVFPDELAIDLFARLVLANQPVALSAPEELVGRRAILLGRSTTDRLDTTEQTFPVRIGTVQSIKRPCPECNARRLQAKTSAGHFIIQLTCSACNWSGMYDAWPYEAVEADRQKLMDAGILPRRSEQRKRGV